MIYKVALGDKIPLGQQINSYDPTKFLRVILRDSANATIAGSPVDLGAVGSLGLYAGNILMPDSRFVSAQYVFYDDAGYTTLSLNAAGDNDTFILDGLEPADVLPLTFQTFNYDASKFVRAFVTDEDNVPIAGSPFNLTPVGTLGLYINNVVPVPATPAFATAQYIVYEDSGYTVVSPSQGGTKESFFFVANGGVQCGGLPWVGDVLCDYFQPMIFVRIVKKVVRFQLQELRDFVRFRGVIQPASPESLSIRPEGERSWKWFTVHAEPSLKLNTDDIINYQYQNYRVMSKNDYSKYGYVQYDVIEDYRGPYNAA